MIKTFK